jgi:hypothetical protein
VYEQEDQTLHLDTGSFALHHLTKALMLLQETLIAPFDSARTNRLTKISGPQVEHLHMLFDFLLASAHAASADCVMKKYGRTPKKKQSYQQGFLSEHTNKW